MRNDGLKKGTPGLTTGNDPASLDSCDTSGMRAPYTAPRVYVTHPSIEGGDTTHVAEAEGGLWTS